MEFWQRAQAPWSELVKSSSPAARASVALLAALVILAIAWAWREQTAAEETFLMGGETFSATQLRDMESAFGKAGLAEYEIDGARIRVPRGQQAKYMAALDEAGALPADFGEHLKQVVSQNSFLSYGSRQEAQIKVAVQNELQLVISRLKGIEKASVHIAEETTRSFPQTKTVTASVGVVPRGNQPIDEATVATIRSFVAGAWAGLKPEAVTVVDMSGNRHFSGQQNASREPGEVYLAARHRAEGEWEAKLTRMLGIPGVLVTPNVELDSESLRPTRVCVSVGVPAAYYEQIWRRQAEAATGTSRTLADVESEERARIASAILPLVSAGRPPEEAVSQVAVTTMHPLAAAANDPIAWNQKAAAWALENWQSLGLGLLIVTGLLVLRSSLKSSAGQVPAAANEEVKPLFVVTDDDDVHLPAIEPRPTPRESTPADTLRSELADLVRQDPQSAASVLRSWIGNAS